MAALPIPLLLSRLAEELIGLHHMATEIEATIDDMVENEAGPLQPQAIRNLQLLDILNQTLLALSAFAANTALNSSPSWTVDAAASVSGIKLATIAQRLAAGGSQPSPSRAPDYELFSDP